MNIFADKCANFKCESTHSNVKYIEILNSLSTSDIPDVSAQHGPDGVRHRGRADLHDRALRGGLGMGGNIDLLLLFISADHGHFSRANRTLDFPSLSSAVSELWELHLQV